MAWNLIARLGRVRQFGVLTAAQNRAAIEAALRKEPLPDVQFHYVDLPSWLHPLLRHQGGIQLRLCLAVEGRLCCQKAASPDRV